MKYEILSYYTIPNHLIEDVNRHLKAGWSLRGKLIVTDLAGQLVYTQVMIKKEV